ncbi:MAG: type I DNA topoisomerase [Deltaproteobacteria bacterium]|jgi:DNA topoisomerase-1|nr:type I DNA topoisomerase [Deltaproteobacteria bacterium]
MKLLIVESPGKTKKIKEYLGEGWQVEASYGHVRDLPEKDLGVNLTTFAPHYVPTERGAKRIRELKALADKAEEVYLATDPDREGEAIAWHLKEALGLKTPKRVTFQEITEKAVRQAVSGPRVIDNDLVMAQEARRVLDRLVGYQVSPALSHVAGQGKSAGRVQSPAVKIVVEREKAISCFKVTTHYGVEVVFEAVEHVSSGWKALWKSKDFLQSGSEYILDKALADKIAGLKYYTVTGFEESEKKESPPAPFTTSALQQAASKKLKFSPKKTMELAQKLYEGGHITYMRTDSPNLSQEAIEAIMEYCRANNLPAAAAPRSFKSKAGSQEAHEAIRATHVEVENAGEGEEQQALYKLIRLQAVASQMADAAYAVRKAVLQSEEKIEDKPVILEASGRKMTFAGWRSLNAPEEDEEEKEEAEENQIPSLRAESRLLAQSARVLTKQTKPPARYTEASLVRELENRGIGRPATYAAILENIIAHKGYLEIDKKRNLVPTGTGCAVVEAMNGIFCFMDLDFTKGLEDGLDEVAGGRKKYHDLVSAANAKLSQEIGVFTAKNCHACPECGKPLLHRMKKGKDGYDFWGCSGWPECKYSVPDAGGKPGAKQEKKPLELSEYQCPQCGKPLAHKHGVNKSGKAYDFYGCSGYPACAARFWSKNGAPDFEAKS